jgi:hypothetical protein
VVPSVGWSKGKPLPAQGASTKLRIININGQKYQFIQSNEGLWRRLVNKRLRQKPSCQPVSPAHLFPLR